MLVTNNFREQTFLIHSYLILKVMMKKIFIPVFSILILFSCSTFKSKENNSVSTLEGNWELNYITGPRIAFEGLYPNKKPAINFDLKEKRISGNNGCNSFSGTLKVEGNKIDFTQPLAVTKMMCLNGQGEQVFMSTLSKIDTYSITENGKTLNFISGDIAMMRFTKK